MSEIKEELWTFLHEVIYRDASKENEQEDDGNYYNVGTIRDQVQRIWGPDIKPKIERKNVDKENRQENGVNHSNVERIIDQLRLAWDDIEVESYDKRMDIDSCLQPIIQMDRDFVRKNFRSKWIEQVESTFRRPSLKRSCQLCDKYIYFNSVAKLIEHYAEFHKKEVTSYDCTLCDFSSIQNQDTVDHWERKHKHSKTIDKYTTSKKINDPKHIWTGDDELVRSMYPKKNYSYPDSKQRQQVYQRQEVECKFCSKIYKIGSIKKHEKTHSTEKPFECDICHKSFSVREYLRLHMKCHSREKSYECKMCLKSFTRKSHLNDHAFVHVHKESYNLPFKCSVCDKAFRVKSKLNRHEKIHANEKLIECVFCQKSYKGKENFARHQLVQHSIGESHACQFCNKKFADNGLLVRHIRFVHFELLRQQDKSNGGLNEWFQGFQTFECYRCKFTHTFACVKKHMEKCNVGENFIKCSKCIQKFDSKQKLKLHVTLLHGRNRMNVSKKDRNYECYICGYSGDCHQYSIIQRHMTTEHPVILKCDVCHVALASYKDLKKHQLKFGPKHFKCKKITYSEYENKCHEGIHTLKCKLCGCICSSKSTYYDHMKKNHHTTSLKKKKKMK